MTTSKFQALISATATAIGLMASTGQANAFSLGSGAILSVGFECNNDMATLVVGNNPSGQWQYVDDAVGDNSGGLHYELYGIGVMQNERYTYFAIDAYDMQKDAGQDTVDDRGRIKYNVGWTDLLISTKGQSIANNNGSLMGIHFGANSAGVSQFGLYENVTANSLAKSHNGYDSVAGVLKHGQSSKVISINEYLNQKGPEVKQAYDQAYAQKGWSLSTYLNNQPLAVKQTHQTASIQKSWSLSTYLNNQPPEVKQAYQRKDWSFTTYLNNQPPEVKQAYTDAYAQKGWTLNTYLSKQPAAVRQAYNSGDQNTRNQITNDYNQKIAQATQIYNDTQTAYQHFQQQAQTRASEIEAIYQQFKQDAQTRVSEIETAYQQFKQDAQSRYDEIRAPYNQMANNFQNSLFGALSNEQALKYFDTAGSGLIKSGTWVAEIEMLNLDQLLQAGYDKDRFLGSQTIAFRIPRPIPEPTTLFGLAGIGLALASGKLRQRNS
ncbi:MAG TPA: hypothetical protein V6D28_02490 [Leptolyngbyaceae cyanobacterium]